MTNDPEGVLDHPWLARRAGVGSRGRRTEADRALLLRDLVMAASVVNSPDDQPSRKRKRCDHNPTRWRENDGQKHGEPGWVGPAKENLIHLTGKGENRSSRLPPDQRQSREHS